jgi:hypothetical protein
MIVKKKYNLTDNEEEEVHIAEQEISGSEPVGSRYKLQSMETDQQRLTAELANLNWTFSSWPLEVIGRWGSLRKKSTNNIAGYVGII